MPNLTTNLKEVNQMKTNIFAIMPNAKGLKKLGKFCHIVELNAGSFGVFAFSSRKAHKNHMVKFNSI